MSQKAVYYWAVSLVAAQNTTCSRQYKETELLLCMVEAMIFMYHIQSRTQWVSYYRAMLFQASMVVVVPSKLAWYDQYIFKLAKFSVLYWTMSNCQCKCIVNRVVDGLGIPWGNDHVTWDLKPFLYSNNTISHTQSRGNNCARDTVHLVHLHL